MTERCEDLDLFFDRELGAEAAQVFRDHLAICRRCQDVLLGRMLEAAVVASEIVDQPSAPAVAVPAEAAEGSPDKPAPAPVPTTPPRVDPMLRRRRTLLAALLIVPVAAGAVALCLWPRQRGSHDRPEIAAELAIALAPERTVEVRFTSPLLDRHRRYQPRVVMRAASGTPTQSAEPSERISLPVLLELERTGDRNALIAAYALKGELGTAERTAAGLSRTAANLTDRAALELLRVERAGATESGSNAAARTGEPVLRPTEAAAAERALSFTAEALRIDPRSAQARWNQAIALKSLGLALAAARVLDEVAELHEPGWSDEAKATAAELRRGYQDRADAWQRVKDDADRMVLGGPVLGDSAVAAVPSLARDTFYLALATASTVERIAALEPLARALDAQFTTTALGELLGNVRTSDLKVRAPLSAELRDFIATPARSPSALNVLRDRAARAGLRDIVLASFLAAPERLTDDADLALLDKLLADNRDEWWKLVALARRAYVAEFRYRDHPAVDALERSIEPTCKAIPSTWCGRIKLLAGGANSQMGRADLAIEQITAARRLARDSAAPNGEINALDALGEAIAIRVTDDIDSAAVAGVFLEEVALRKVTCQTRMQRLDFAAIAALQQHRFDEAARLRQDADRLERAECRSWGVRLNGEMARLRLVLHGQGGLETLRDNLARLRSEGWRNALYVDFIAAAATVAEDRSRGETALRQVLARANAEPPPTYAAQVRAGALDVLVESAAEARDAKSVLALLTERVRAPSFDRCVLGVASWNHLVVAALDASGDPAIEIPPIPEGVVLVPAAEVVSPRMRARLAGCGRVEVLTAQYFGAPRLLDDRVAWVYHAGTPRAPRDRSVGRELVVSGVTPPEDLHLAPLQPFSGGANADVLSGQRATPARVLAGMKTASLAVIVAHGFIHAEEPTAASLVLSPDAHGDYLLTAAKVRSARFDESPIVILAGCDSGRVQVSAEPWSLATSFLEAGARIVIAPTEPIPDDTANDIFRSLIERIRTGADPVDAVVAERTYRGATAAWMSSIVMFE